MSRFLSVILLMIAALPTHAQTSNETIRVGAKNFTEQEVLGEIVAQLVERETDLTVERRFGLGGTDICHAALLSGEIDVYVEYTGTALLNVLKRDVVTDPARAYRVVARSYKDQFDLEWLAPIGFNNTYAITVRAEQADREDWSTISDLRGDADDLKAGFTSEFMERPDGYPGLRNAYDLRFGDAVDLEPGLMYEAAAQEQVDVICAFATDGRIAEYELKTLDDDLSFFPPYDAAPVVRIESLRAHPELRDALRSLDGTISDAEMREMNHAVDVRRIPPSEVAAAWIEDRTVRGEPVGLFQLGWNKRAQLLDKTLEHIRLTIVSMAIAIFIGVPLGIFVHRIVPMRGPVLAVVEIVQTIPSLAMLAFLFAVYGVLGAAPAVTALVLYALLPIVLNTFTGLSEVPLQLIEAAHGTGMSNAQRLRLVELPLAAPVIIAGIRAATVLTIGIATLSTYIGAGGLGDFIARGLARNDARLTLLGAAPAAILAVLLSLAIRAIERSMQRG